MWVLAPAKLRWARPRRVPIQSELSESTWRDRMKSSGRPSAVVREVIAP